MLTIEVRLTINRPIGDVFAFLTDTDYQLRYDGSLTSVRRTPAGPVQKGTKITEVRRIMGRRIESHYEVIDYEPNSRWASQSIDGMVTGMGMRSFEATPEGTSVIWQLDLEQSGLASLMAPLFGRMLRRSLAQDLSRARRLLESGIEVGVATDQPVLAH